MTSFVQSVSVRGFSIYECHCGASCRGDTQNIEITPVDGRMPEIVIRPTANAMPVGWASYLGGVFKCPNCLT